MPDHIGIYEAIVESTASELILFFVILAVVVAVVVVPLYVAMLKDRKAGRIYEAARETNAQAHERESRQQIIDVVKENSAVIASLKTSLKKNGDSTVKALKRIHTRLDEQNETSKVLHGDVSQMNTRIINILENQSELAGKVNKILVIASGGSLKRHDDS